MYKCLKSMVHHISYNIHNKQLKRRILKCIKGKGVDIDNGGFGQKILP